MTELTPPLCAADELDISAAELVDAAAEEAATEEANTDEVAEEAAPEETADEEDPPLEPLFEGSIVNVQSETLRTAGLPLESRMGVRVILQISVIVPVSLLSVRVILHRKRTHARIDGLSGGHSLWVTSDLLALVMYRSGMDDRRKEREKQDDNGCEREHGEGVEGGLDED